MKRALFCCALVIVARASFALDPARTISQYGHTAWRVRDGHFPGTVTAIAQTRDGYLWVGTDGGLLRYDGVRFELWVPPGANESPSRVVALLGASDGSLWIGTSSGLAQWTSGLAQWNRGRYTVHETAGRFGALLEDRRGTVWAGRTRGRGLPPLCRVEQGRLRCFAAPGEPSLGFISALHEDREGELWMGGAGGVCRWRGGNPECFPIPELLTRMNKTGVFRIGHDAEGVLWVDSANFGAQRLLAGTWSKGETAPVFELKLDRAGSFWIGTQDHGLIRRIGARVERFTEADGLSGNSVANVLEDREGNVWVATTAGLDRFRDVKVATVTTREGLPFPNVGAVTRSSLGGVWVSDHRALVRMTDARPLAAPLVGLPGAETGGGRDRFFAGGLLDQRRNRLGLRDVHGVASGNLGDGRAGALGHQALRGRRNHPVVLGDEIPARLRLPGRLGDRSVQRGESPRHLRVGHEARRVGVHVAGEGLAELGPVQQQEPVDRRQNRRHRRAGGRVLNQRRDRLAFVRGKGRNVDEPLHLGMVASLRDHHTAVRVADENDRSLLRVDDPQRRRHVVSEGRGGVLDYAYLVAALREDVVNGLPAGTVHESAVNEDDGHCCENR